jgi:hypothetical protein
MMLGYFGLAVLILSPRIYFDAQSIMKCSGTGLMVPGYMPLSAQWGTGVKTNAKGGKTMNVTSLTSWKSHDVVPNASFTRHDVSHCSVDVAVFTELCISAAYRISSSGSSFHSNRINHLIAWVNLIMFLWFIPKKINFDRIFLENMRLNSSHRAAIYKFYCNGTMYALK